MRIPRWLLIPFMLVFVLYWTQDLWQKNNEPTVFDLPKTLEENQSTLIIYPVSTFKDLAVFTTATGDANEYLYLTPAADDSLFPYNYKELRDSGYLIKVTGKFFKGKAIPPEYLYLTPKPERLRVFQFETLEMIPPTQQSNI
jgi:hypothetical protein